MIQPAKPREEPQKLEKGETELNKGKEEKAKEEEPYLGDLQNHFQRKEQSSENSLIEDAELESVADYTSDYESIEEEFLEEGDVEKQSQTDEVVFVEKQ